MYCFTDFLFKINKTDSNLNGGCLNLPLSKFVRVFQGGLFGFLASLIAGLTMAIGSIFHATYKQLPPVPLTNDGCEMVTTLSRLASSIAGGINVTVGKDLPFNFFNLSYLYYSPFCLLVGVLVATFVSLLTGNFDW